MNKRFEKFVMRRIDKCTGNEIWMVPGVEYIFAAYTIAKNNGVSAYKYDTSCTIITTYGNIDIMYGITSCLDRTFHYIIDQPDYDTSNLSRYEHVDTTSMFQRWVQVVL